MMRMSFTPYREIIPFLILLYRDSLYKVSGKDDCQHQGLKPGQAGGLNGMLITHSIPSPEALHCYLLMGVHDESDFLTSELSLLAFTFAFSLSR